MAGSDGEAGEPALLEDAGHGLFRADWETVVWAVLEHTS
jgi:hypothetical protein